MFADDVILDLGGYTISTTSMGIEFDGAGITIQNGTISTGATWTGF